MLNKLISNELFESAVRPLSLLSKMATHMLREKLYNELHNKTLPSIFPSAPLPHIMVQYK